MESTRCRGYGREFLLLGNRGLVHYGHVKMAGDVS